MTVYDLGTITTNTAIKRDNYTVTTLGPDDIFKFRTLDTRSINLLLTDIQGGDADLQLYRDNGNGVPDSGDALINNSAFSGNHDDQINRWRGAGTYFARVSRYSGSLVSYDLYVSATQQFSGAVSGPPNLLAREDNLGNLGFDVTRSGSVGFGSSSLNNTNDTADIYYFELGLYEGVTIRLNGLSADADIRLIQDFDGDRVVDPGEVVASSTNAGTLPDSITRDLSGNYFLEVYPYAQNTNTNYTVTFDHFATSYPRPVV
jgi:hypothetical protein